MKKIMFIIFMIIMSFVCIWLHFNTGLKGFEKEVSKIEFPETIEKIAIKSGIGDSGGNGDFSTHRVVLVVKTKMSIDELKGEFKSRISKFLSQEENTHTPMCYITHCENKVFKSNRDFTLTFNELDGIEDFCNYYFIEFIK